MTFFTFARGKKDLLPTDPGSYNVPSSIGKGPKFSFGVKPKTPPIDHQSDYIILPSTLSQKGVKLGNKNIKSIRRNNEQSPGYNFVDSSFGKVPKISFHGKYSFENELTPGPGAYSLPKNDKGLSYSCGVGPRVNFITNDLTVGPGSYEIDSTLKNSKVKIIVPPKEIKKIKKTFPGPVYYSKPIGYDSPKFSFPKGPREKLINLTPGPGEYNINNELLEKRKIYTSLHIRTESSNSIDYQSQYYSNPTTIKPKKISIGNKPKINYETISPGPAYEIPSTIKPKKISFGSKIIQKENNLNFPGPDSYWTAPVTPIPPPIYGMMGPLSRCPINENEEKNKPGPGSYNIPNSTLNNKGFTIKNKKKEIFNRPDTTAPYYGIRSTLSGPKFSIGVKD